MYVTAIDMNVLKSPELKAFLDQYEDKFKERFIAFNYADFHRQGEKCAAQVYRETLEKALLDDKPYHIESKRYSFFDH